MKKAKDYNDRGWDSPVEWTDRARRGTAETAPASKTPPETEQTGALSEMAELLSALGVTPDEVGEMKSVKKSAHKIKVNGVGVDPEYLADVDLDEIDSPAPNRKFTLVSLIAVIVFAMVGMAVVSAFAEFFAG